MVRVFINFISLSLTLSCDVSYQFFFPIIVFLSSRWMPTMKITNTTENTRCRQSAKGKPKNSSLLLEPNQMRQPWPLDQDNDLLQSTKSLVKLLPNSSQVNTSQLFKISQQEFSTLTTTMYLRSCNFPWSSMYLHFFVVLVPSFLSLQTFLLTPFSHFKLQSSFFNRWSSNRSNARLYIVFFKMVESIHEADSMVSQGRFGGGINDIFDLITNFFLDVQSPRRV